MFQNDLLDWMQPGIGFKRWLAVIIVGGGFISLAASALLLQLTVTSTVAGRWLMSSWTPPLLALPGVLLIIVGGRRVLAFVASLDGNTPLTQLMERRQRQRGPAIVAIGGGTGLPTALRALKRHTSNITAVVTVADAGGSSGRLRREMGVLPPGDLRNNIVALADNESLMAHLFQYRFEDGDLRGHSFGNLFISALSSVTDGGLETALAETARVLNIQGRVLPSTLSNVDLRAQVRLPGKARTVTILGEAAISEAGGSIEHLELVPGNVQGYRESVEAILRADMIVLGPGSLYTSILPNLLVPEVASALRATPAYIVYICNVATQPGETTEYTVAEHVMAIENLIGRGVFQAVLANNAYPTPPADSKTIYVQQAPPTHQIMQRYEIFYTDLTDNDQPWRHDPEKLSEALVGMYNAERAGHARRDIFADHPKAS